MNFKLLSSVLLGLLIMNNNLHGEENLDADAKSFLEKHELMMRPMEIAANLAWWDANTTGSPLAFEKKEKAQLKSSSISS